MTRTIVVSDVHGDVALLEAVLLHASFTVDDTLIVAGDMIDIGTGDVIGYAERSGAVMLPGNHEIAAALGLRISPQNQSSLERGPELMQRILDRAWPLAIAIEGYLITHAGISTALTDVIETAQGDVERIARALNEEFVAECTVLSESPPRSWGELSHFRLIGGQLGPLWFRPLSAHHVPWGVRQIAGHTPPEMLELAELNELEDRGLLMIEPSAHESRRRSTVRGRRVAFPRLRYAIIEDGSAQVVEA